MSNRRFDVYQYSQIIFRLRQGDSIRGIAQAKLADRKKVRQIHGVAIQQGWLNIQRDLPTDEELLTFFKLRKSVPQSALTTPYKDQIEEWVEHGIQASTSHAALQRQHGFSGS